MDMKVELLDHMGSDLTVVNAARVSMDKESSWQLLLDKDCHLLKDADAKLINYLAKHNHWTPFGHCFMSFRIKAPIFVARQLGKHQVGLVWNEVSRRYVDSGPEFYTPEIWRERANNVKQGSGGPAPYQELSSRDYLQAIEASFGVYYALLKQGVCPEQSRMVLPQSMMTEWIWSGSLMAFVRVCKLRLDPHSQRETREIAEQIAEKIATHFPVSWSALMGAEDH